MVIIAILFAIAIPMFMNSRLKAQASEAKANANTAWNAMRSCSVQNDGTFEGTVDCTTAAAVLAEEPGLQPALESPGCQGLLNLLTGTPGKTCTAIFKQGITGANSAAYYAMSATRTTPPVLFVVGTQEINDPLVNLMSGGAVGGAFKKCFTQNSYSAGLGMGTVPQEEQELLTKLCPTGNW